MILAPEDCGCPYEDRGISIVGSSVCSGTFLFMVLLESYLKGRCIISDPCKRLKSIKPKDTTFAYDFIVVGAGAAGPIVASRLSENENFKVLLIEAGGPEPVGVRVPSFYRAYWFNEQVDWRYRTVPADYCLNQNGRGCMWPRGKVMGGCTALHGMMYHRGHPEDYNAWVKAGAVGWSWEENWPYFGKTEGNKQIGTLVNGEYHSDKGPLPVQQFRYQPPFAYELLKAANESGFPVIEDMNDINTPEGFVIAQTSNADGQRYTTSRAFLESQPQRDNLSVMMYAHVTRVLIDKTRRAYGVEYIDVNGDKKTVTATKEVILSAGALNTPQILMLSGIGPKQTLKKLQIPLVKKLPVGKNLMNHVGITLNFLLTKTSQTELLNWTVLNEYLLQQRGPMSADGITQVTGLLYSSLADRSKNQPDLQLFFNGFYAECSKTGGVGQQDHSHFTGRTAINISASAVALLPRSFGYVTINSSDPLKPPLFFPNYFAHPDDMVMVKDGARYLQRIYQSKVMQEKYGIILDPEYTEACSRRGSEWSDAWLECMARLHTDPQNHQMGTAAIGQVVDTQLKVYGIEGLRVIDASVIPSQVTGNPQGAIMMVAERGAAFIKEKWL